MAKVTNTTSEDVRASIGSIYADLLSKRRIEKEAKAEQKRMEEELRKAEKEEKSTKEDGTKMTKKEKREKELDNWKTIVVGLTGDDLEYSGKKNKKKKYRKWIDEEDTGTVIDRKPKKHKKRNYNKEFEPELNMLKTLVAEQNRFTADLQRRFQHAAGPATKDAAPPNKTMVELASAITSGRTNSLGMLREIGSLKKTIADLYMKQKKLDADLAGGSTFTDTGDLALMGSNIAASMFGNSSVGFTPSIQSSDVYGSQSQMMAPIMQNNGQSVQPIQQVPVNDVPVYQATAFDPETWEGPQLSNTFTEYENVPHTIVVKRSKDTGDMRFAAIRNDNGEEITGCNIPTSDPNKLNINEKDMTVKGQFDEVYRIVEV